MSGLLSLVGNAPVVSFAKGEVLIREKERLTQLFVLKEGELQVIKDGVPIASISNPGSAFGEISLLLGIASTATVLVKSPSEVVVIENPMEFLRSNPEANLELARLLARRVRWLTINYAAERDDGDSVFWQYR